MVLFLTKAVLKDSAKPPIGPALPVRVTPSNIRFGCFEGSSGVHETTRGIRSGVFGALLRWIVEPLPLMVIGVRTMGNPEGHSEPSATEVRTYVPFGARLIVV